MEHISGIIKRVMADITVENKTDPKAEKKERQRQWDEAMGTLEVAIEQSEAGLHDILKYIRREGLG